MKMKMQQGVRVSIVIPVYNGSDYMRDAIDSALAQTYPDVEVIVVNDGSCDGGKTEAVALGYGDRIRYFSKENGGVSTALNFGIGKMTGSYFSWLSHDDMYYPGKIADQVSRLTCDDGREIVYCGYDLVDERGAYKASVDPRSAVPPSKDAVPLFALFQAVVNGCSMLIPKALFDRYGMFDPALRSTQDYALWLEFFKHPEVRLTYSPFRGVKSRQHAAQGTNAIANHAEACCDLWISMMDGIDSAARARVYGNDYAFYHRVGENLAVISNYTRAVEHARRKAEAARHCIDELMAKAKVSVVIPFYNRGKCVVEALRSAQAQTFRNLEILLVDDGSEEDLSELVAIAAGDSRVRIVRQPHGGAAVARNRGLSESTGDHVAFLDSDDLWLPEKVERQLRFMLENGYEFSYGGYLCKSRGRKEVLPKIKGICFSSLAENCAIATPTVMICRDLFKSGCLLFPEGVRYGEDVMTWLSVAHEHEIGAFEPCQVIVRVDEKSCQNNRISQIEGLLNILSALVRSYEYDEVKRPVSALASRVKELCYDGERESTEVTLRREILAYQDSVREYASQIGSLSSQFSSTENQLRILRHTVIVRCMNFLRRVLCQKPL